MKKFTIFLLTFLLFVGFINVNAQTRVHVAITGPSSGCIGEEITLTAVVSGNVCPDYSLFWHDDKNPFPHFFDSNVPFDITMSGNTMTFRVPDPALYSFGNTFSFRVWYLPNHTTCPPPPYARWSEKFDFVIDEPVEPTINVDKANICPGQQVTATVASTGLPADYTTYSYIWYRNGFEIPGQNLFFITENIYDIGTFTYAARYIDTLGCESPLSNFQTVTVGNDIPKPVIERSGYIPNVTNRHVFCNSDKEYFTYQIGDISIPPLERGNYDWDWYCDGAPYTEGVVGHFISFGGMVYKIDGSPYIFTVQITDKATGCVSMSDPFEVYGIYAPGANGLTVEYPNIVCEGESVTLTALPYPGLNPSKQGELQFANLWTSPAMQFQWTRNPAGATGNTPIFTDPDPQLGGNQYTVYVDYILYTPFPDKCQS